jgi:predicted sulfurtransferase
MATFDQRGQKVKKQTNVGGDMYVAQQRINFAAARNAKDVATLLERLIAELNSAAKAGSLEPEVAVDAKHPLEKAVLEAKKPEPQKNRLLEYVAKAKQVMADAVGASKAAATLGTLLGEAWANIKELL